VSEGRRSARRQAVFVLYQQDLLKIDCQSALKRLDGGQLSEYGRRIAMKAETERERIDGLLRQHVTGWSVERLGVLERAILRIAVCELLTEMDVPMAVVVDEAVTLAKRFCSVEAGSLVNGILGSLATAVRPEGDELKGEGEVVG
jgi:N utilization substance protein B